MSEQIVCPRCGARDSFRKGYLPDTCVCRVCESQLGWKEIPGCGPDCTAEKALGRTGGKATSRMSAADKVTPPRSAAGKRTPKQQGGRERG
jgi:hypothetical protein